MPDALAYVLVFAAVASLGFLALSALRTEVLERASLAREPEGNVSPLRRLVSPVRLATLRLNAGFGAALAAFVLFSALDFPVLRAAVFAAAAGAAASFAPAVWYRRKSDARVALFQSQVLDLVNGIASGLRAGLSFPAALDAASRRTPWPMNEEIKTVLRESRLGVELPDALARLNARLPSEDLALVVGAVRLTMQSGGSLAEVMEKMVDLIRARNDFQERLKNITAQGRFEAAAMSLMPLVVFVILFLEDRPLMMPLVTTETGWAAIAAAAGLVAVGYFWIRRIVTIEV